MKTTKTFAVVSIASVTGIVIACGGKIEREATNDTGTSPTATATTTKPGGRPGGGSSSSGFGSSSSSSGLDAECPRSFVLTEADLEADPGWKPPTVSPGACTDADLTQLKKNFEDANLTSYFDLRKKLSSACAACAVSNDTDATWGPIVGEKASSGASGFVNFGACFAHVENETCGKSLQFEQLCYEQACNACASTTSQRERCISAAGSPGGMCQSFRATTQLGCPNIGTSATKCRSILDAVKLLCGI